MYNIIEQKSNICKFKRFTDEDDKENVDEEIRLL